MTLVQPVHAAAAPAARGREYLVAADPAAESLYVYRTKDLRRTGRLDGIELASHAGTLQLPDGRLIFVDDRAGRVVAMTITAQGRPRIAQSVDIPGADWDGATWAAADARLRYFAFSGGEGDDTTVTLVDLRTFAIHQIPVTPEPDATGNTAETQVYLAGRPLQLVITTGGQFRTLPVATIVAGQTPAVTSAVPVGPSTHGPVVARSGDAVYSTTADGFDGASIAGARLTNPRSVDYSRTRNVVQNYRPRLAADGRTVWGAVAEHTGLAPADWADTRNNVNAIDLPTFRSSLVRLPDGITGRFAVSRTLGAVTTIHPDGDVLTLLDVRRGSANFRRIVGTVALPPLSGGPVAGTPASGTENHVTALTPSGGAAFVSNGGDGSISVIDTRRRRLVASIDVPTALAGGGYLTVVKRGTPVTDLIAR
jgi:DNA-binding beta-propeller fold protein YncE